MLGSKEPNLYKDLSQGTVTKGIWIKIFFQKKILKNFFFENLDLDPDPHPYVQCGSRFGLIQIQIAYLDHHLDPDPDFQKKKIFFEFLLFLTSLL